MILGATTHPAVRVITGGGSGIGAATAKLFVAEGAQVLIVGRTEEKLKLTVKEIDSDDVSYVCADVARVEDTQRYVGAGVERYGGIDVVVSNAGIEGPRQDHRRPLWSSPRRSPGSSGFPPCRPISPVSTP